MWNYVERRFQLLNENLLLNDEQIADANTKLKGIVSTLNRSFWDHNDESRNAFLVGSWRKGTVVRPPNDVDLFFIAPNTIFNEFNGKAGNVQSQLLQRFRLSLLDRYPQTNIRGDGQVVVVGFNSLTVEVVPAFPIFGGGYNICDTNGGGRWKAVDPDAEILGMNVADDQALGNVRKLTRMIKQWARHRNVPLKGFHIEHLVKEFLGQSSYARNDEYWFDWLVRDFFAFLLGKANSGFLMPGTYIEWIDIGDAWKSKAERAHTRALNACDYERRDIDILAGLEWEEIFGNMVPTTVTI
jgi:hypothetical protein